MKSNKKVSSASSYRQNLSVVTELPSGQVFKLRKISVTPYLKNGRMPEELFKKILRTWNSVSLLETNEAESKFAKELSPEEIEKMLLFQTDIVSAACVEPKIVVDADPEDESALNPDELSEKDFIFIFTWAISGGDEAKSLENFRRK